MSSRRTVLVTAILWVSAVTGLCLSLNVLPRTSGPAKRLWGKKSSESGSWVNRYYLREAKREEPCIRRMTKIRGPTRSS
jgi:hypothetical protein